MSDDKLNEGSICAVAELARRERKGEIIYVEHGDRRIPLLLLPNDEGGIEYHGLKGEIDAYNPAAKNPETRTGTAKFRELESFLAHVARFKDADSVIWANPDHSRPTLMSVLDYHQAVNVDGKARADALPRFGRHRGVYTFETSPEFNAWAAAWNGSADKAMSQADFAKFVEARIVDVADPIAPDGAAAKLAAAAGFKFASAADLVTLSRGLRVHVKSVAAEGFNPTSGETELTFTTEHSTTNGDKFTAPRAFLIEIPVFRGGDKYLIVVWLRYRLPSDNREPMRWWLEGYRITETFDHAFNTACKDAAEKSGLPVYVGEPE